MLGLWVRVKVKGLMLRVRVKVKANRCWKKLVRASRFFLALKVEVMIKG